MLTPTADHLAQHHAGWGLSALSPLGPQKLEVLGDGAAAGPGRTRAGGVPARFFSEVHGAEGEAVGPPAETVPCVSSKGQGRGPASPRLREGLVLFTSVRWLSGTGSP